MGATKRKLATCEQPLASGPRTGEPCGKGAVDGSDPPRCRQHAVSSSLDALRHGKKEVVLAAYRETGIVGVACDAGGVSRATFYNWLDADPEFASEAMAAVEHAADRMEAEAIRRGVDGVETAVFDKNGNEVGTITKHSDVLLIFMLKARRPQRFRDRWDPTSAMDDRPDAQSLLARDEIHAAVLDRMEAFRKSERAKGFVEGYAAQAIEAAATEVDPSSSP